MDKCALESKLNELCIAKRNGELDKEEFINENDKWRNVLEYEIFETCVKHYADEIRLKALTLIVESKKSTLSFTKQELNILMLFLKYNLGERLEFVPVIKKALKRLKDSYVVMQRQLAREEKVRNYEKKVNITSTVCEEAIALSYGMSAKVNNQINIYNEFFLDLLNICVNNIYPDATYNRRRNSLQIMCLMQNILDEFFKSYPWNREQADKIFRCLLLDTYEPNKEMCFKLLGCMSSMLLQLDVKERVHTMVNLGIQLGNSIRPIDSVTATYVLKITLLSPLIEDVLYTYFNIEKLSGTPVKAQYLQMILILKKELKKSLLLAKKNIVTTVITHSIYGYIFCIRNLVNDCNLHDVGTEELWKNTVAELISICFELNQAVSLIVNNSSPEGHLPMDLNPKNVNDLMSTNGSEMVTPQMVLLCSWRTVKEVSLLFGALTTKLPICNDNASASLLTNEQIIDIGEHLFALLSETKHRGAFEQAHVGFSQLCTRLWRLKQTNLNQLPIIWLHQILLAITGLMQGNLKLSATRRSAGIPFMIQALVATEPHSTSEPKTSAFHSVMRILLGFMDLKETNDNFSFSKVIKSLIYSDTVFSDFEDTNNVVEDDTDEYSVDDENFNLTEIKSHALNILRALYRHSELGDLVKIYIADGLIAAFKSYDAETWAERNAATLLFSALIIRIFGVQRTKDHINLTTANKMTGKIFFERYPSLLPFILDELQTFVSIDDGLLKPSIHSILLLLSRLYISPNSNFDRDINWEINEFIALVSQCAKSPVYKTRELAARALVPFLTENSAVVITKKLIHIIASNSAERLSLNATHGYLLQVYEIMKNLKTVRCQDLESDFRMFVKKGCWILKDLSYDTARPACFPLASAYINTIHELVNGTSQKTLESFDMINIFSTLKRHLTEEGGLKSGPGQEMYRSSAVKLVVSAVRHPVLKHLCNFMDVPARIHTQILSVSDYDVQVIAWSTVVDVIKEMESRERKLLYSRAVDVARNSILFLNKISPDLQDAIFDFLYKMLKETDECHNAPGSYNRLEICDLVLEKLRNNIKNSNYCERCSYIRLLGKSYTTMRTEFKMIKISSKCKEDVYIKFCDQFWISELDNNFIESVFEILYDLFILCKETDDDSYCILQWWTILLQSLIDDCADIRREASKIVCKIEPENKMTCITRVLEIFFLKFTNIVGEKYPKIAIAALFYWGIALLGDTDYEMDDTDVFNKCKNYDVFEPVQISHMCAQLLKSVVVQCPVDQLMPSNILNWINSRLYMDLPEHTSFRQLISSSKNCVPELQGQLQDILDPMYKDKLLQILTYNEYEFLCATNS